MSVFCFYIILIRCIFTVFGIIIAIMIAIHKAFKFRLNPTTAQAQQMVEFAGANRFVWNKALALNLARLENKQPLLWYFELVYWLGLWKQSEE
jgi:putative transposase